MWPAMFIDITVQISRTFCISYPLITRGPRSNSSSLTFIFSEYFVWRSDCSLAQRLLKKKKNHQPVLSHFCNVNKSIKSKDKNKVFSPRSGVVYSPGWRQKFFFLPDKAPINLRFNQNIQGLLLFNKVFLVVLEDFHKEENSLLLKIISIVFVHML